MGPILQSATLVMSKSNSRHKEGRSGWVWTWLLVLALLLLLIKYLLIGTYYIASPRSLLFVSIQSQPQSNGDMLLVEIEEGELSPAIYRESSQHSVLVEIEGEPIQVSPMQLKGKVIGKLNL